MKSMRETIRLLSEENTRLSRAAWDPQFLCIRIQELHAIHGSIPKTGVFITINSTINSTLSIEGDWGGETLTVPFTDIKFELRNDVGDLISESRLYARKDIKGLGQIFFGTNWKLEINVLLGFIPS